MTSKNKKRISMAVAVIYSLCILLVNPTVVYGVKEPHQTAEYKNTEKMNQSQKTINALSKLPATVSQSKLYDSATEYQILLERFKLASKEVYSAKAMGIKYKNLKYYYRLDIAKKRINVLSDMLRGLKPIIQSIEDLPRQLTTNDKNAVYKISAAFNNLKPAEKKMIPNKEKLDEAIKAMDLLSEEGTIIKPKNDFDVKLLSAKLISNRSIRIIFDRPVEDMSKVSFNLRRERDSVTTSVIWDEGRKEATLLGINSFSEGTYYLDVKNNGANLGSSSFAIAKQRIGKITINSTKLLVDSIHKTGYATYKVYDQYNNDITNSNLAQKISFQVAAATVTITAKDGVLTLTSSADTALITAPYINIKAFDAESGVTATASLATINAIGTLSDFQFVNGGGDLKFIAGDMNSVFFIPYTAKDAYGNETNNYQLVSSGLIKGTDQRLYVSNPNITVKVVKDPNDANKAAIQAQLTSMDSIMGDIPVTISAMTYAGTNSILNTTLRRGNQVSKIILYAPKNAIAIGDKNVEIPFAAYDESGNKITRAADLDASMVTLSGLTRVMRVDGTLKLILSNVPSEKGFVTLSATVKDTGESSTLDVSIENKDVRETLHVDPTVLISAMESGATQSIDFGNFYGGLSITDPYDRVIDMLQGDSAYKVAIATSDMISVDKAVLGGGLEAVTIKADGASGGSGKITFKLFKDTDTVGTVGYNVQDSDEPTIDTKTVDISIIKTTDINGYALEMENKPLYAVLSDTVYISDRIREYSASVSAYGRTNSETKVVLAGEPVIGSFLDNPTEFMIVAGNSDPNSHKKVYVIAVKPKDNSKSGSFAYLSVNILHNGFVHSLKKGIVSYTAQPLPTQGLLKTDSGIAPGVSVKDNIVAIKSSYISAAGFEEGKYITDYMSNGASTKELGIRTKFYFSVLDSYGTTSGSFAQIVLLSARNAAGEDISYGMGVDNYGKLSFGGHVVSIGDEYIYKALTSNGLQKTIKIIIE